MLGWDESASGPAVVGGILPAFDGNVPDDTGIFAALTRAQVGEEI